MGTRWFRDSYEKEYERYGHPERSDEEIPEWEVDELCADGYQPNPTTGYDPEHDKEMRFFASDWADLIEHPDIRADPVEILPRDMQVSAAVCERLRRVPDLDLSKVGVYSEAGVVTLSGHVGSREMKRRVVGVVSRVPKVAGVVDRLQVAEHA